MAASARPFRSPRRLPRPARPRVPGQVSPPPPARAVLLSALERAGLALAFGAGDPIAHGVPGAGEGVGAAECASIAAELRVVYASLRSLRLPA